MHDNRATSDGGTDQTGMSEGDKAVEFYSKKVTSSYDSHSIEQIDSASESEEKHSNDVAPTESSTPQKVCSCELLLYLYHVIGCRHLNSMSIFFISFCLNSRIPMMKRITLLRY